MKSTGILRKVDQLGRVVLPIELRRMLNINTDDAMEIFVEDDAVILKKYVHRLACQVTGEISDKNLSLASGTIILSPAAAKEIFNQLQQEFKNT
ncbi:AbrB/MazE/SpoVT family DNA-binding domain-containing protein [Guptibacillus algicola]|uniref:AbrB/MazE/SpoVT family DNA-binding domain-containing protein n=1 Tax=Guptibacillus algicola TaxID=225844 RepID=UPI001CD5CE20|nr:AbrB/MazE/SpoVT family DNA-binding domain-containing protein [Alkalihalobacillus algicola]MCA0986511.1 AbrB/MazE/SpoVT family DNA-binding domain-containing protein [Alkalihalobacillus algicola]